MYKVPYVTNDSRIDENFAYLARSLSAVPAEGGLGEHNLLSASHGDTLADSVVRGDIIYGDATPKWARMAKGSAGLLVGYNATDVVQINPNTLDVDKVDGSHASAFASAVHTHPFTDITTAGMMYVATNVTNATQVMANVTGLSFAVEANKNYKFSFDLKVDTTAAACAIWYQFTGPNSPTSFWAHIDYYSAANTPWEEELSAFSTPTAGTSQATQAGSKSAKWIGFLINGANAGIVQMQFRCEVASQTVTIYAGSSGIWNKLN